VGRPDPILEMMKPLDGADRILAVQTYLRQMLTLSCSKAGVTVEAYRKLEPAWCKFIDKFPDVGVAGLQHLEPAWQQMASQAFVWADLPEPGETTEGKPLKVLEVKI
jgi:hypothetical protein